MGLPPTSERIPSRILTHPVHTVSSPASFNLVYFSMENNEKTVARRTFLCGILIIISLCVLLLLLLPTNQTAKESAQKAGVKKQIRPIQPLAGSGRIRLVRQQPPKRRRTFSSSQKKKKYGCGGLISPPPPPSLPASTLITVDYWARSVGALEWPRLPFPLNTERQSCQRR